MYDLDIEVDLDYVEFVVSCIVKFFDFVYGGFG